MSPPRSRDGRAIDVPDERKVLRSGRRKPALRCPGVGTGVPEPRSPCDTASHLGERGLGPGAAVPVLRSQRMGGRTDTELSDLIDQAVARLEEADYAGAAPLYRSIV